MSLPFVPASSAPITIVGCPPLVGLTPGATYIITGLVQGTLGTFDVVARALDATTLSGDVSVFPSADVTGTGWDGQIDWADCQLLHVYDNVDNDVSGKVNVGRFPWHLPITVHSNNIDKNSNTNLGGAAFLGVFANNSILNTGGVVIGAGAQNNANLTISGNTIIDGTLTVNYAPVAGSIVITDNFISGSSTFIIQAGGNATSGIFQNNQIAGSSSINWLAQGNLNVVNTIMTESTVALFNHTVGTLSFNQNNFSGDSSFTATESGAGASSVSGTDLASSTMTLSGTNNITLSSSLIRASTVTLTAAATPAVITAAFLERGTFSNAGFDATNIRLEDATSVLIANITDAVKSGYVNALP